MLNLRMCVFIWRLGRWVSSDYNDSVFCKGETSTAIGMIKEKKKTDVQNWKKSKDKKSSKIQPAPVLVRMFWGRFRTRSDSIGHARGRLRTRSDSIGRASQRPWTRLDEWPDPVRSRPASDTFPDPSPESDSSRFVRSLNLPIDYSATKCFFFFDRQLSYSCLSHSSSVLAANGCRVSSTFSFFLIGKRKPGPTR